MRVVAKNFQRIVKSKRPRNPKFSLCCIQAPPLIDELLDPLGSQQSKTFRTLIRSYNAMFTMTSMGGKVDSRINNGRHPYIFKLNGQNHHRIGTLLPNDGQDPQFAQLYFYDTENEVENRMNIFSNGEINSDLDPSIVDALVQMFDESNTLVKIFRMSRDRFFDTDVHRLRLRLIGSRTTDGREYNLPTCSEIAAIIVGDIGAEDAHCDIIVELKEGGLQRINVLHPSYMALQYPLLFPYGEDGFRLGILYSKRFVLPSSFTRSPRYMIENYQDAMAICRWAEDRPDVVARVFKIKLDQLLNDLKHGQHFGKVIVVVYIVEYQKRGLPHAHILLFLHHDDKHPTAAEIDKIISAEIPDLNEEHLVYEAVKQYMVHGPCGSINSRAGCMIENKCTKHFPKKICSQTTVDEDGFPIYRRRNNGRFVERNEVKLDNRFIVPYNIELLVKFQAHINVEWCNRSRSIKNLFKYITKRPDRATLILEENLHIDCSTGMQHMTDTDEVKTYLNCRYPAVQRLSFHNEDEQPVVFEDTDYLNNVVNKLDIGKSKFTVWMKANALYEEARELTYSEFPTKWVWHKKDKEWKLRKYGRCIGRIYYAHLASGEWFYLWMLLNVIKGPRSFEEMRTINNVVYPTFRSTCYALGLLDDDKEWHEALNHASYWASGKQLRELFVIMLIFCELLSEDILHRQRTVLRYDNLHLDDFQLQNYALCEIEQILIKSGRSLHDFETIPYPNTLLLRKSNNRVLQEELDYDRNSLAAEHIKLLASLNIDQRNIYDEVIDSVSENKGGFYFRSEGKIVIAIASSGIAALLLPGGRTAHSRFQTPINVTENSTCGIKQGSQIAELMTKASLIVWDEAPMAHRNCFEAVDQSLRDILRFSNSNSGETPFGGKTIVLGGDFRQILPVISKGRREQMVEASINKSSLWNSCKVFILTLNMRLTQNLGDIVAREFAEWILKIGDGELRNSEGEALIEIPHDLLIQPGAHPFNDIVKAAYPDFDTKFNDSKYLEERAILAPTSEIVEDINGYMIDLINVDEETFLRADSLCLPIMLLRNLNQSNGLCNGTRLLVTQLSKWVLEAQIISGTHIGEKVFIPRIVLSPSDSKWPFVLKRRQFPVFVCFAMTINKSQDRPVFSHGHKDGLRILIVENDNGDRFHTKNIVYKEIFDNLPKVSYHNEVENFEADISECEMELT
ncbi:hypothetical protein ACB092_11G229700 [Castanea dentata]